MMQGCRRDITEKLQDNGQTPSPVDFLPLPTPGIDCLLLAKKRGHAYSCSKRVVTSDVNIHSQVLRKRIHVQCFSEDEKHLPADYHCGFSSKPGSSLPTAPPASDLNLLKVLVAQTPLWCLREELVALTLFDRDVDSSEKRKILKRLSHEADDDLPKRTTLKLATIPDSRLRANGINVGSGAVQGWASPTLPLLHAKDTALDGKPITTEEESWLGSLPYFGAFIAAPLYGYVNQNLGRKAAAYLTAIAFIVGWLFIIFSNSMSYFMAARFIMGLGVAGANVFVTMYVGEVSEDGMRGSLGVLRGLTLTIGYILVYVIGSYLSITNAAIVNLVIPIIFLVIFFWMPESPMFLLGKGRRNEAFTAYLWMRGGSTQAAEEEMSKLSAVIQESEQMKSQTTVRAKLSTRGTRKALLIAVLLAMFEQFSGINVVFSYCATIFEMAGGSMTPEYSSFIVSIMGFVSSVISYYICDRLGRRLVLITTYTLQGLCVGALGLYIFLREKGTDVSVVGVLPIVLISLYVFCGVTGASNMFYVVLSEIFRPEVRGIAMGITNSLVWLAAFLVTKMYPPLSSAIGDYVCFWLFAVICIGGAIFTFFQVPETKNRSLESILIELNGGPL
ncbi:facilitated trehalose transporter Tret1-like [Periplaneta americana]|uniref:facilitated trehalose transporter Tret1-like n=1 Tax=Periplaneta americana TaxID=6978 RepID=UPI0037E9BCEC